jgi:hypothetical protein
MKKIIFPLFFPQPPSHRSRGEGNLALAGEAALEERAEQHRAEMSKLNKLRADAKRVLSDGLVKSCYDRGLLLDSDGQAPLPEAASSSKDGGSKSRKRGGKHDMTKAEGSDLRALSSRLYSGAAGDLYGLGVFLSDDEEDLLGIL